MLLRPLLAVSGLATVIHAILVVPEVTGEEIDTFQNIPVESIARAQFETINVDCAGCPSVFKKHGQKPKHHKQPPSHLELDFSIEHSAESDRLMLNGFELYPNSDPFTNILVATQIADKLKHDREHEENVPVKDGDNTKALLSHHKFRLPGLKPKAVEQQLGFSLSIHSVADTADESLDLVVIDFQIIEVGDIFVEGLPNIRINLIKSPMNELLIGKIEQTVSEFALTPMVDEQECITILCKWKAIIADQLETMKMHGCAGMLDGEAGHGSSQGHHGHHGDGMGYNRHHGWTLLFRKLTSHIILPVLVGIVSGVSVSIIGMIVATILVGLWRKLVRGQSFFPQHHGRRHHGASHHKAARKEAAVAKEKSGLLENQEEGFPPSYDEDEARTADRV